ncbi:hypothetical protein [Desulforhopalus singaporensis]|uniref:Uncharacterized protein n=1 Tax=Desulforhopalus singaporensis TaxID=91360 RepID=A0A1H0NEU9_9BACT|nr:hypothetical protein [Desulforhopalus singaporensis]SDO90820.1 hypothetical protein SAMN05660330_01359 [Desulforhopalus singaporensis]
MDFSNYTLYTSGLKGSEATFGEEAEKLGIQEVVYSFEGHKLYRDKNVRILDKNQLERGDISMELASRMLNRTYYETDKIRKVLQTIFHMINSGHQVFVVGSIQEDGSVKGGTGWAVELAKMFNRPLHVFDQPTKAWYTWKGQWQEDSPRIEYETFVGSGTRYLSDAGRNAISQLFIDSFKS